MRRWLLVTIAPRRGCSSPTRSPSTRRSAFGADDHPYGSVYWLLTGLHGAHVTAGSGGDGAAVRARRPQPQPRGAVASWAGGVSLFWHLVDVIWVFVFATIWVMQ